MNQWLGWDDPRYDTTTHYWRHIFPTMDAFTTWCTMYFKGKSWQHRWDTTDKLIKQLLKAMEPYHDLSKDEQKLPENIAQIKFLRAQCVHVHALRTNLVLECKAKT